VINVAANGTFSIRPETFSLAELSTRLKDLTRLEPKPAIIIRANKETDYKHVADLLDACKAADLTNLAFANEAVGMLKKE
jgi:biopolymer transport protein ExbD